MNLRTFCILLLSAALARGAQLPINNGVLQSDLNVAEFSLFSGAYFNFGITPGPTGYGIRDNAGRMEFKHSAGTWTEFGTGEGGGGGVTLPSTSSILKGDGAGGAVAAVSGTDFLAPNGSGVNLTGVEKTANRAAASGYPSLDASTKIPIAQLPTGTSSSSVTIGNDTRLPATVTGIRKGAGAGSADTAATAGTDYLTPSGSGVDLTGVEKTANRAAVSGYASLDSSTKVPVAQLPTGVSGSTVAIGNDTRFPATVTGIRKGAGQGSTDTAAAAGTDYVAPTGSGTGLTGVAKTANNLSDLTDKMVARANIGSASFDGGTDANNTWASTGATSFTEAAALTANRTLALPAASNYNDGAIIRMNDGVTTGNFGRLIKPGGSDWLVANGSTLQAADWITAGYYKPFIGGGRGGKTSSAFFEKRSTPQTGWTVVDNARAILSISKTGDASARVLLDLTNVPTATDITGVSPQEDFVLGVVPETEPIDSNSFLRYIDGSGAQHIETLPQPLPDPTGHAIGEVVQIIDTDTYGTGVLPISGSPAYQVLTDANPVVWNCIANKELQNAFVEIAGNREIQINNASDGYRFNLLVKQGSGGSRLITKLPTGSRVSPQTAGLPVLSTTVGAVDWLQGSYAGPNGWVWNLTKDYVAPTPAACATPCTGDACGDSVGTNLVTQNASNRKYLAANFVADATSVCKVTIGFQNTLAPTYNQRLYIAPDAIRTSGANVSYGATQTAIHMNAAIGSSSDIGQKIVLPGTFGAGPYFVNTVVTTNPADTVLTVRAARGGPATAIAAANTATAQAADIYGVPGASATYINLTATPVTASMTGLSTSSVTDVTFSDVGATGLTIGENYWLVVIAQATFNGSTGGNWTTTDYANFAYDNATATSGFTIRTGTAGTSWASTISQRRLRFSTTN